MPTLLRAAAHSIVGGGAAARVRGSGACGFLAPRVPQVFAPVAPSRPFRYTPPVQVGFSVASWAQCAAAPGAPCCCRAPVTAFSPRPPPPPPPLSPPHHPQMGRRSAKIAVRKGKADAKKAKVYGRIGKKIIQMCADPCIGAASQPQWVARAAAVQLSLLLL